MTLGTSGLRVTYFISNRGKNIFKKKKIRVGFFPFSEGYFIILVVRENRFLDIESGLLCFPGKRLFRTV